MLCYITLSRCHADDTVRCLPVPGVSHTECHSPGPRSALCVTALGAGPAGQSRVSRCPGCPRHKSRDQLRDTGDTRHWPARLGCPGRLVHRGCSAHLSHCPHPGTWSLVTPGIPDPPWSPPSNTMMSACSSTSLLLFILLFQNQSAFSWSQVSVTVRLRTVTRLAPELHNVSS